jgi:general secretion pathway protein H
MSTSRGHSRRAVAGFTLVELLAVLAIIAFVAAVAMPQLSGRSSDRVRLDSAARRIVTALRVSRAIAILRNTETAVVIDVEHHEFSSPATAGSSLDPDIAVELTIASTERETTARGAIRFFPDGSSTGGDIFLRLTGRQMRICVNWASGETRLGADC